MTRLIDADAYEHAVQGNPYVSDSVKRYVRCSIQSQPTIDAEPQWIPCSEMLPKDDRSKVVTLANGNTEVGYYSNGDWWCIGDSFRLENPTVIAWMPLPKPYEGDKE